MRYAMPGYTFVLLVVWLNLGPLFIILKAGEASSIFAGFLTVFSGSAIGFLVSQVWWRWFNWRGGLSTWTPVTTAIEKYHLRDGSREDRNVAVWVFDYVLHSDLHTDPRWDGLSKYCHRKWDVYIVLSCTMASLVLGTVFGISLRVIYEVFMSNHLSRLGQDLWFFLKVGEFWVLVSSFAIVVVFYFILRTERRVIRNDYDWIHTLFIGQFAMEPRELGEILDRNVFRADNE